MATMKVSQFGTVIDSFYEAAALPELWHSALDRVSEICGADGALLITRPAEYGMVWTDSLDEAVATMVKTGWYLRNERMNRIDPFVRKGRTFTESNVFSPRELDHHPFNAELMNPMGLRWYAGLPVAELDGVFIGLSLERRNYREPYSKHEVESLDKLIPHLRRAGQLALTIAMSRVKGMGEGFEKFDCGAVFLDHKGKVLHLNDMGRSFLGKSISVIEGHLHARDRRLDPALQRLIASALTPGLLPRSEESAIALSCGEAGSILAYTAPVVGTAQDVFQRARAVVLLRNLDQQKAPAEALLQQLFGLTPAEARLAHQLGSGLGLDEAASMLNISYETARTNLKRIFLKVGVSRQSALVLVISKLPSQDVSIAHSKHHTASEK